MLFKALQSIFSHDRVILTLLERTADHNGKLDPSLFTLKTKILHLLPHLPYLNIRAHQFVLELLIFTPDLIDLFIKKLKIFILRLNFLPTLIHLFLTLVICNLEIEYFLLHIIDDLEVLDGFLLGLVKLLVDVLVNMSLVYLGYHTLVHWRSLSILIHLRLVLEVRNDTIHLDVVSQVFHRFANQAFSQTVPHVLLSVL